MKKKRSKMPQDDLGRVPAWVRTFQAKCMVFLRKCKAVDFKLTSRFWARFPQSGRIVAFNEAIDVLKRVTIIATNLRPIEEGEWLQISPWGEFPNEVGLQRMTRQRGDMMVTAFNSFGGRLGRFFKGVPIYVGHPDRDRIKYPDHRRYGKITDLEARDDGLYGKVAWNDLGKTNFEQGYHVYPSAVWACDPTEPGVIEPAELVSVGLTNFPNIDGVRPWAANEQVISQNAGTSAGAKKGWATRRGKGWTPKSEKGKAAAKKQAAKKGKETTADILQRTDYLPSSGGSAFRSAADANAFKAAARREKAAASRKKAQSKEERWTRRNNALRAAAGKPSLEQFYGTGSIGGGFGL